MQDKEHSGGTQQVRHFRLRIEKLLSLYSTAMQNHSRWVLALASTSNATLLRHLTQNIPTCWYILALPNAKICVTPDAKPKICVTPDANP